ncbi:MAG: hypothetical protein LBJ11_08355 [Oscillospiraceae bacterium]|jgi:hypothetical protein|nr:hypothetical protein [Oscillospiraceae bacterium]
MNPENRSAAAAQPFGFQATLTRKEKHMDNERNKTEDLLGDIASVIYDVADCLFCNIASFEDTTILQDRSASKKYTILSSQASCREALPELDRLIGELSGYKSQLEQLEKQISKKRAYKKPTA